MKKIISLLFVLALSGSWVSARETILLNDGWKFSLGMPGDFQEYYSFANGPVSVSFNDANWKSVVLPHDWAVDAPFSVESIVNHGYKTIGWQFPENSVGWYRRKFDLPSSDEGKDIILSLESVRGCCDVFCNGIRMVSLDEVSFAREVDLSRCVKFGADNELAIRVDATDIQGPYYEGAGIVGNVTLSKTGHLRFNRGRIRLAGINRIGTNAYLLDLDAEVFHDSFGMDGMYGVTFAMYDGSGRLVSSADTFFSVVPEPGQSQTVSRQLSIANPSLWSDFRPYLYTVTCELTYNGEVLDRCSVKTGIRDAFVDPNGGVMINGKVVKIHAACTHQDFGAVGSAVPDALWKSRLSDLKALGCNAVRFYGRPVSEAALAACDELGILAVEEVMASDMRSAEIARELALRDSFHPSLIMWNVAAPQWALDDGALSASLCAAVSDGFSSEDKFRHVGIYSGSQKWMSGLFFTEAFNFMGGFKAGVWPGTVTTGGLVDYSGDVTPEGESFRVIATGKKDRTYEKMLKDAKKAGRPFQVKAVSSSKKIKSDGEDIVVIDVSLVDENGRLANSLEHELTVYVDARPLAPYGSSAAMNGKTEFDRVYIVGAANGNPAFRDVERPENSDAGEFVFKAYKGKARVIIRSVKGSSGKAHVRVGGSRLHGASLNFEYVGQ